MIVKVIRWIIFVPAGMITKSLIDGVGTLIITKFDDWSWSGGWIAESFALLFLGMVTGTVTIWVVRAVVPDSRGGAGLLFAYITSFFSLVATVGFIGNAVSANSLSTAPELWVIALSSIAGYAIGSVTLATMMASKERPVREITIDDIESPEFQELMKRKRKIKPDEDPPVDQIDETPLVDEISDRSEFMEPTHGRPRKGPRMFIPRSGRGKILLFLMYGTIGIVSYLVCSGIRIRGGYYSYEFDEDTFLIWLFSFWAIATFAVCATRYFLYVYPYEKKE